MTAIDKDSKGDISKATSHADNIHEQYQKQAQKKLRSRRLLPAGPQSN